MVSWLARSGRAPRSAAGLVLGLLVATACVASPSETSEAFDFTLPIPQVLEPVRTDAEGEHYEIDVKTGLHQAVPSLPPVQIEGYNGTWPGPTIVARRDRPSHVTFRNQLAHTSVVHNHGHEAPADSDGHPTDFILPGASKTYHYPNQQRAGTFWYHDHVENETEYNIMRGQAGFYVIKDDAWDSLNLPKGEFDIPLLFQDRWFNGDGSFRYGKPIGDTMLVNGVRTPRLDVKQRRYMFRLLNGSTTRGYSVTLLRDDPLLGRDGPRVPFDVISSDAGLLEKPVRKEQMLITPGERYGVIIDFSKFPVGTNIYMRNRNPIPATFTTSRGTPYLLLGEMMTFRVMGPAVDDSSPLPERLTTIEKIDPEKVDVRRTVVFSRQESGNPDRPRHTINGVEWDPGRIDFHAKLGQTELWDFQNESNTGHVLHVHLVPFQLVEYQGTTPPLEQQGWKDTVFLPNQTNAKFVLRWQGFPGIYVIHCHYLDHEDTGMMAQIKVDPPDAPP
jgi:spore coat protein A